MVGVIYETDDDLVLSAEETHRPSRSVIAALFIARRFHRFASLPSPVRSFVISLCSDRARRC